MPPYEDGKNIKLPKPLVVPYDNEDSSLQLLVKSIYLDISNTTSDSFLATKRAILTSNEHATKINSLLVHQLPESAYDYKSFDNCTNDLSEQYPFEFLNSLAPSSLPPHHLTLKVGSPIILLRNLDPTSGLCNGTRLVCRAFFPNVIDAEIIVGHHYGQRVFIPRIPLQPSATEKYPFRFTRKQFPINLSFAMTINKSQGQTLDRVGIYLPQPVFFSWLISFLDPKNGYSTTYPRQIDISKPQLPHQSRNFTTTATLVRKHPPKTSRGGSTNLQQLVFEDAELPDTRSYLVPLTRVMEFVARDDRMDIIGIDVHIHDIATIRSKSSRLPIEVRRIELIDYNMKPVMLSVWITLVTHEVAVVAEIINTMPNLEVSRVKASTFNDGSFNTTFSSTININPSTAKVQLLRD
uniref:ATP-dependent DNA helicase n=1 Tax=Chenopodium quinoa TaxID=63459 RepID=A0A803MPB0_CHEQI